MRSKGLGTLAACGISHSPLMGLNPLADEVNRRVQSACGRLRNRIVQFDPELLVVIGPDHYRGFRLDVMPQFCVGLAARTLGDFGTRVVDLPVQRKEAEGATEALLKGGFDVALSERMEVDHGFAQPLELLFPNGNMPPMLPLFINCLAHPLTALARSVALGAALGRYLVQLRRRVLVVGSGGLSHDPPVPRRESLTSEARDILISRVPVTVRASDRHEAEVAQAGRAFAKGGSSLRPLNPRWDSWFLESLARNDLEAVAALRDNELTKVAGIAAHEVRTWLAAYGALAEMGDYTVVESFYEPVPEWIVGFGVTFAVGGA